MNLINQLQLNRHVLVIRRGKVALVALVLGTFGIFMGCSASTDDPVFGTRLPDIGAETESPTPVLTVATLTPTPDRGYVATPESAMQTVAAVETTDPLSTPTLIPSATPMPTPTPSPIPLLTPTPTPVRLEVGDSGMTDEELANARQQMLRLINSGRLEAGLDAVELDDNPSAQLHANDMRANCFSSQWGSDGSDPTVRYNSGGATDAISPYVIGSSFCPDDPDEYVWDPIEFQVASSFARLSSEFDLLDATFRKVAIGMSYERPNLWVELVFATNHSIYLEEPRIEGGVLSFAYMLTNGAREGANPPNVFVHYSRPLQAVNTAQLSRTYASSIGQRVAGVRPPAGANSYWTEDEFEVELSACRHPYDVDPSLDPPESYPQDAIFHQESQDICDHTPGTAVARWITSGVEELAGGGYRVTTDLQAEVSQFGAGIYTLQIWAVVDGTDAPVSEYSIFVE